jgi:hypothetical protein
MKLKGRIFWQRLFHDWNLFPKNNVLIASSCGYVTLLQLTDRDFDAQTGEPERF